MNTQQLQKLVATFTVEHPLRKFVSTPFYKVFEKEICSLSLKGTSIDDKIEELLKDNGKFSIYKYNQGISELLIWFLFEHQGIGYEIEKSINGTDKNVDVQAQIGCCAYNIEVKSPEYEEKKDGQLYGIVANRTNGNEMLCLARQIEELLKAQLPKCGYNDLKMELPKDNKVKSALTSAQGKFANNSDTQCNLLFVSTTTDEFIKYLNYITNDCTGFFTQQSYIPHTDFNKVKAIILSNALSLNTQYNGNSWDISHAINLILSNPFCEYADNGILKKVFEIIPNQNIEFFNGLKNFREEQDANNEKIPELSYFIDYVAEHGYRLNQCK